ncbi:MAG: Fe-S cluster assembly ATPase SufC [Candidatus Saccharibacteria bacterium]|nr:Fe-S cluster assembly ATPase SufC [Candidatus Saccharibacteria bacterium]
MLKIRDLSVSVGSKKILKHISFELSEGKTTVLMGPNGSGKSTIVKAILGDDSLKCEGEVLLGRKNLLKLSPEERAKLGIFVSMQNLPEISGVTTVQMLAEALRAKGEDLSLDEVREKIFIEAKKLGLDRWFAEKELNVQMSGGEKKKNEILQMLVLRPQVAILDEIDSGLDKDAVKKVSQALRAYQKETGATYLIITHGFGVLDGLGAASSVLLDQGKVLERGGAGLIADVRQHGYSGMTKEVLL